MERTHDVIYLHTQPISLFPYHAPQPTHPKHRLESTLVLLELERCFDSKLVPTQRRAPLRDLLLLQCSLEHALDDDLLQAHGD